MRALKRFYSTLMASVLSMSIMCVTAYAAYPSASSGQQSKATWKATTGVNAQYTPTTVSASGYYYVTTTTFGYTGGGNGGPGGCTVYLNSPEEHGWQNVYSTHGATGYDTLSLSSSGHYVSY